jgi:hypothetical protein
MIKSMGKDPAVIWRQLPLQLEGAETTQWQLDLRQELNLQKMTEGTSLDQFLYNSNSIIMQLPDFFETVDNATLIYIVLSSLMDS